MKSIFTVLLLTYSFLSIGQNLVSNGGFEEYSTCPPVEGYLYYATPWVNYADLSPDFFHECSSVSSVGVPYNNLGYQMPSSGNGYAGIFASQTLTGVDVREYISIQLDEPLQINATYNLQFNVNLANSSNFALETIGAYFSTNSSLPMSMFIVDVTPQIINTNGLLTDTLNWMTISGTYHALGGEEYLTIGNFEDDNSCGMQAVEGGQQNWAYYHIDDVILSGITSIAEYDNSLQVYPNPFKNNLQISSTDNKEYEFLLYDLTGRLIYQSEFVNSTIINTDQYAYGVYFYELLNSYGVVKKGKVIKD